MSNLLPECVSAHEGEQWWLQDTQGEKEKARMSLAPLEIGVGCKWGQAQQGGAALDAWGLSGSRSGGAAGLAELKLKRSCCMVVEEESVCLHPWAGVWKLGLLARESSHRWDDDGKRTQWTQYLWRSPAAACLALLAGSQVQASLPARAGACLHERWQTQITWDKLEWWWHYQEHGTQMLRDGEVPDEQHMPGDRWLLQSVWENPRKNLVHPIYSYPPTKQKTGTILSFQPNIKMGPLHFKKLGWNHPIPPHPQTKDNLNLQTLIMLNIKTWKVVLADSTYDHPIFLSSSLEYVVKVHHFSYSFFWCESHYESIGTGRATSWQAA